MGLVADGFYITQWDVRVDVNNNTLTSLGARCSDGSLLTSVPASSLQTAGPDVYFVAQNNGGVDDLGTGWDRFLME